MYSKISVIVPVYNVEKYINKCLDSIVNQTYKNLEIILVDDGSPDNCGQICEAYASKDARIRVIHQKNGGPSAARNTGLDAATGRYVGFIDPDDFIHESYYETMLGLVERCDVDISQCYFRMVYEEGDERANKENRKAASIETVNVLSNREALHNLYTNDFTYVNACVVWNKLYKKELFDGIRFPEGKIHEDEHIIYKLFFKARQVAITTNPLYFYLQRSNSYMGMNYDVKRLALLDAYFEQIHFYREKQLFDLEKKAKLNFEGAIRNAMSKVLFSRMDHKDQIFNNLLDYYRKHYKLFTKDMTYAAWKKIVILLFGHSSRSIIKFLIRMKYYKSLAISR
jgi:glycosyltransferase involved in cell wall biosynthesis